MNPPYGKVCKRVCVKRMQTGACKKWHVDIFELSNPDAHNFFSNAGFVLIREGNL